MVDIRWTQQAADDLENIAEYIAVDSEHYAKLFVIDLVAAIERLSYSPARGRMVPEFQRDSIREIFFGNYRIIFRLQPSSIEIITIYHGARLMGPEPFDLDD